MPAGRTLQQRPVPGGLNMGNINLTTTELSEETFSILNFELLLDLVEARAKLATPALIGGDLRA